MCVSDYMRLGFTIYFSEGLLAVCTAVVLHDHAREVNGRTYVKPFIDNSHRKQQLQVQKENLKDKHNLKRVHKIKQYLFL